LPRARRSVLGSGFILLSPIFLDNALRLSGLSSSQSAD